MTMDKEINGRYVLAVLPSNKAKELRDARFDLVRILHHSIIHYHSFLG